MSFDDAVEGVNARIARRRLLVIHERIAGTSVLLSEGPRSVGDSIPGGRHHLERATELLADRETPDHPNSIKESISAVEAVVKKVTAEGTLSIRFSEPHRYCR